MTTDTDDADDDDSTEWNPTPATLRDGETADISGHARTNLDSLREGVAQGLLDPDEADDAAERIVAQDRAHDWGDD